MTIERAMLKQGLQIRNPNFEIRNKFENPSTKHSNNRSMRTMSYLFVSDLVLRISDFARYRQQASRHDAHTFEAPKKR